MILKTAGIKFIDSAFNGYEGLNMVIKKQYDLVLCDLNMPVKDGYQCCE
jgi:YesN/AraC family two-component response regulator